jgi:hypothetical protein
VRTEQKVEQKVRRRLRQIINVGICHLSLRVNSAASLVREVNFVNSTTVSTKANDKKKKKNFCFGADEISICLSDQENGESAIKIGDFS